MKDAADHATTDLFPVAKKRGRPATGAARTAAERQRKARNKKFVDNNKDNLNVWIDAVCKIRLQNMASEKNCSIAEMIETLIREK